MGLTKSKGNMYDFVDYHWNVIKGRCEFDCVYCYVKSSPRFKNYKVSCYLDANELKTNLGKDRTIFVGSKTDMWGLWVTDEQIQIVLEKCAGFPLNTFYFQTKNPVRYFKFLDVLETLDLFYLGTTVETDCYGNLKISIAPSIPSRVDAISGLSAKGLKTFVTIEPIMSFNLKVLLEYIRIMNPNFVTIGSDSKGHNLPEPVWPEVQRLIENLEIMEVEIKQKPNLNRLKKHFLERPPVGRVDRDGIM